MTPTTTPHTRFLAMAARLAARGHGGAEPNPLVGCILVAPDGTIVGEGYHRQCGEAHAERLAIERAGPAARGSTAYITLEPCNHHGRTPPCSEALLTAGVARVVYAREDPNKSAAGGADRLREAGVDVSLDASCAAAVRVSDPFVHRVTTGLPWVIAKWAQTIDGRIATRSGASRWISNERSRRLVHRERGRVDAILTGIGTVLADDPALTARHVRVRRTARRIVVDPDLVIPIDAKIVRTAHQVPTTVLTTHRAHDETPSRVQELERAGVEVIRITLRRNDPDLAAGLREIVQRHAVANVLVECGGGLLGALFRQRLVSEALVFIAPLLFGDERARPCVRGMTVDQLTDGTALKLSGVYRRDGDVLLRYRTSG